MVTYKQYLVFRYMILDTASYYHIIEGTNPRKLQVYNMKIDLGLSLY